MPVDGEDRVLVGRIMVLSMLVLWCAAILGTAVRIFIAVSFGNW